MNKKVNIFRKGRRNLKTMQKIFTFSVKLPGKTLLSKVKTPSRTRVHAFDSLPFR